jgi:voltage-gated potassium channel
MWWSVVPLTTVEYGDVFPITPLGKFFGSIISFLGIGLFALPAGILGAGFLEEMRKPGCPEPKKLSTGV